MLRLNAYIASIVLFVVPLGLVIPAQAGQALTLKAVLGESPLLSERAVLNESPLHLMDAIAEAVNTDPWLQRNKRQEAALFAEGLATGQLPEPKFNLSLINLATDSVAFDQEPMTQFKVGVAQVFPRGDSRALRQRQKREEAAVYPFLRQERQASLALRISTLWLDTFLAQQSVRLIEGNRYLFNQLIDITHANYITTTNAVRQQDVIRAELELTQLSDRLSQLWQDYKRGQKALGQWLQATTVDRRLPKVLPEDLVWGLPSLFVLQDKQSVHALIRQHPRLKAIEHKMQSLSTGVELARQLYEPEWTINAAYGYRDDTPGGKDRADLVSLGLSVELPLFTVKGPDQRVLAANYRRKALQAEWDLIWRKLLSEYQQARVELEGLDERNHLYTQDLLPQIHDQADAALLAYTVDQGDFSEVMRTRIAELNAKIMALDIQVQRHKVLAKMHYFVVGAGRENTTKEEVL